MGHRISKIALFLALLSLSLFGTLYPIHLFAEHYFYFGMVAVWVGFTLLGSGAALTIASISALVSAWYYVLEPGFAHLHWIATGPAHITVLMVVEVLGVTLLQRFAFRNASLLILVASYWAFFGMPAHILVHGLSPVSNSLVPLEINGFAMNLALGEFIAGLFHAFLASVILGAVFLLRKNRGQSALGRPIFLSDYFFHVIAIAVTGPAILFVALSVLPAQKELEKDIESRLVEDSNFFKVQVDAWFEARALEVERLALQSMSALTPELFGPHLPTPALPPGILSFWLLGEDEKILTKLSNEAPESGAELSFRELTEILRAGRQKKLFGKDNDLEYSTYRGRLFLWGGLAGSSIQKGGLIAELSPDGLNSLLGRLQKRTDSEIVVKDFEGQIIARSQAEITERAVDGRKLGEGRTSLQHIQPLVLGKNMLESRESSLFEDYMNHFAMRFSHLSQTASLAPEYPFNIVATVDVGSRIAAMEKSFVVNIQILLALMFMSLCAIKFGSRRIVAPLRELMNRANDLTRKAPDHSLPAMTISPFSEIQNLQMNFLELAKSLSARFDENKRARAELEMRVFERTRMLQRSNDSLASEIAERKLLAEDRDRIIGILQTAADFIAMATPEGEVIWLNEFARRSQGLQPDDDLSELRIVDFHPPWAVDRIIHEAIPAAIRNGFWVGEGALIDRNGNVIPVSQMIVAHKDSTGQTRYISTIQRDMRGFKKVQEELENAKSEAEAANRSKTLFLANMSHEVRTPVAVIRGFAELLNAGQASPSERRDWLRAIVSSSRQLELLINDILDISKVESGKLQFEVTPFNLVNFISELKTILDVNAQAKGLRLEFVCESFVPEVIRTDVNRLRQILMNLIGNAIKFTDKGSISVRVGMFPVLLSERRKDADRSPAEAFERPPRLRFKVCDTGTGISPENQSRLFQPFVQADQSISRRFGGTGLGLYLSRQLAHLLGGNLRLDSSVPGEGSVFSLEVDPGDVMNVPLVNTFEKAGARSTSKSHNSDEKSVSAVTLNGCRVLVVEDAPELRLLFGKVLRTAGATVEFAHDGQQGLERVSEKEFDLVLMDLQMPRMSGYSAMEELKKRDFRVPVVALTAHALVGERERCLELGFTEYLTKPVHFRTLTETVARLWGRDGAQIVSVENINVQGMKDASQGRSSRSRSKPSKKSLGEQIAEPLQLERVGATVKKPRKSSHVKKVAPKKDGSVEQD